MFVANDSILACLLLHADLANNKITYQIVIFYCTLHRTPRWFSIPFHQSMLLYGVHITIKQNQFIVPKKWLNLNQQNIVNYLSGVLAWKSVQKWEHDFHGQNRNCWQRKVISSTKVILEFRAHKNTKGEII